VRRANVVRFFEAELATLGAAYVTSIPIHDIKGHSAYTLVHASHNPSGREAMKDCVQTAYSKAIELGYAQSVIAGMREAAEQYDPNEVPRLARLRFGPQLTNWTLEIRPFLMRETTLWPWQMDDVKSVLAATSPRAPGRTIKFDLSAPV
jgi:hypothetical protein